MSKEVVTAETNLNGTKRTRTPKDYNAIKNGALKLSLEDRVNLKNSLTISIDNELKAMEQSYNHAKKLIEG